MMALLCLTCAALAIWWAVPPPRAEPTRAPGGPSGSRGGIRSETAGPVLGGLGSVLVVGLAVMLDGARGVVLGLAAAVLGWTVAGLFASRRRTQRARLRRSDVAQAGAALAALLRVGQVPSLALATAAEDHPVLCEARDAQDLGGDVGRVWRTQAREPGYAGLLDLARAWQVAVRTGAPMSATLEQVAAALAVEQSVQAVVAGELSAPRATGKVMAVLPGCGVGLGYLLGGEPIGWLLGGPLGWGCLLGGVVMACLGVLWIEALARRAAG